MAGSTVDATFFFCLTIGGFITLSRRGFQWGTALRLNSWLTALLLFMAVSVLWSNYPSVSFRRYVKVIGSVSMALVVVTNQPTLESIFTVLRRCLYVHLPMSIICTRYFRQIGIAYDYDGSNEMWQGISTSKNTLGQIAMLGTVYFIWEIRRNWPRDKWRSLHFVYLMMALYLLKGSEKAMSMTSVSVCVFAVVVCLRIQALRHNIAAARNFVLMVFAALASLVTLIVTHSIVGFSEDSLFGTIITKFGRDITLTDRTYIWSGVYDAAAAMGNPLLGVGYGGFWIGREANITWNATMTWVLGQAHNGYIDTYLQIGLIGTFILVVLFFKSIPQLLNSLVYDFDLGCFRITLFLTILLVNITETTFLRGDHHLWLVLQLALWMVPSMFAPSAESENVGSDPEDVSTDTPSEHPAEGASATQ